MISKVIFLSSVSGIPVVSPRGNRNGRLIIYFFRGRTEQFKSSDSWRTITYLGNYPSRDVHVWFQGSTSERSDAERHF